MAASGVRKVTWTVPAVLTMFSTWPAERELKKSLIWNSWIFLGRFFTQTFLLFISSVT